MGMEFLWPLFMILALVLAGAYISKRAKRRKRKKRASRPAPLTVRSSGLVQVLVHQLELIVLHERVLADLDGAACRILHAGGVQMLCIADQSHA